MQEHTHREFKLADAWLDEEWYHPTRSDYFLMRIAQRVQQVAFQIWGKDAGKVKLSHQEVFGLPEDHKEPEKLSKEELEEKTEHSKSVWAGLVGLVRKKKNRGDN